MHSRAVAMAVKRLGDLIVSTLVLILLSPLWALIAVLVAATSRGPILFLQERPGREGVPFVIYKFRTMRPGSELMIKGHEVAANDARITPIGRLLRRSKLDEVPQLLNVLKGDMSLVGPRPERMSSLVDYPEEVARRLRMRPGLTGLAQVSGNIYLDLADRYKLDVYYVDSFSVHLDVAIMLRTVGVVLFGEDKYLHKDLVRPG